MRTPVRVKARWPKWLVMAVVCGALLLAGAIWRYQSAPLITQPNVQSVAVATSAPSNLAWPGYGQAAVATKTYGVLATSGSMGAQATASTAKLITALAVMRQQPFDDSRGATLTFSQADVKLYDDYLAGNGTVTPVSPGLQWTQYQALQAVLLDSANNISDTLAIWAFGSLEKYRQYAQGMVEQLGMDSTTIGIDASGYSATTTSTAADLARLAVAVLDDDVLRQIVGQSQADLPGAGLIQNTNRLLGSSEVIGLKTGWIPEAGGVFVLAGEHQDAGGSQEIITVVMGAPGGPSRVAQDAAYKLYQSAKDNFSYQLALRAGQSVGSYQAAWSDQAVSLKVAVDTRLFVWGGSVPVVEVEASGVEPGGEGKAGVARIIVDGRTLQEVTLNLDGSIEAPPLWWRIVGRG